MWKKDETPQQQSDSQPDGTARTELRARRSGGGSKDPAVIGSSISIRGEVTGDEDLLIQGRVDGSVDLKKNSVTVGPEGKVKAGIAGRVVVIEGTVEGDLTAEEQVILRSSASVQGDITAPRVVLEDGARFRGGVDMGDPASKARASSDAASSSSGKSALSASSGSGEATKAEAARPEATSGEKKKDSTSATAGSRG